MKLKHAILTGTALVLGSLACKKLQDSQLSFNPATSGETDITTTHSMIDTVSYTNKLLMRSDTVALKYSKRPIEVMNYQYIAPAVIAETQDTIHLVMLKHEDLALHNCNVTLLATRQKGPSHPSVQELTDKKNALQNFMVNISGESDLHIGGQMADGHYINTRVTLSQMMGTQRHILHHMQELSRQQKRSQSVVMK